MRTVSENRVFEYQGVGSLVVNPAVCVRNSTDYSPFGVSLDGRAIQTDFYRRGFNGMELDDEMKGIGNSYDFGARMYDSRVGRWLTIDPLAGKYPDLSPYNFVANSPLLFVDPDGKRIFIHYKTKDENGNEIDVAYTYGSGIKLPNDRFVRRTVRALSKLEKRGLDPNGIIESLKSTDDYNIVISEKPNEKWSYSAATTSIGELSILNDDGTSERVFKDGKTDMSDVLSWNSNAGWISKDGKKRQSPACVLLHELGHKFYTLFDPLKMSEKLLEISKIQDPIERDKQYKKFTDDQRVISSGYQNYADMWIIQNIEPHMHEGIRKSHSDGFILKVIGGVFSQRGFKCGKNDKIGKVKDLKKGNSTN